MRDRPLLLDLFCGAGGAAQGYYEAGFDVVGVDIVPQPRYPFRMVVADAATYPLGGFDAVHASPPCQDHSVTRSFAPAHGTGWLLAHTIERLSQSFLPWVVENVPGARAEMPGATTLCGSMFGLGAVERGHYRILRRHRLFLASFPLAAPAPDNCRGRLIGGVYGHGAQYGARGYGFAAPAAREAMGIPWATRAGVSQAIPPAYTRHVGDAMRCALA